MLVFFQKSATLYPTYSQLNPIHTFKTVLFKIHLNIFLQFQNIPYRIYGEKINFDLVCLTVQRTFGP